MSKTGEPSSGFPRCGATGRTRETRYRRLADIEAGCERVIGPTRMRSLKEALPDIARGADPASVLGGR